MNSIVGTLLLVVGIISALLVITIFLGARAASQGAVKQNSTRLEVAQPQFYPNCKLICNMLEDDNADGETQIVDTSLYEKKKILNSQSILI